MMTMVRLLLILLVLLIPELAMADAYINPPSGNAWDLYVFGNARVIADTLESIKLVMAPQYGHTGYNTLMLFMATLGFLVLAIRAGFNPSQGFVPMFTYILIAWLVSWGTTTLKIRVNIIDSVETSSTYSVDAAPAIVALPAVLVSSVGNYFTKTIEGYFSSPPELKMTGDRVNGFNIFARMLQESNQFTFTDTSLKSTLRAYMADCTVPAIAAGKFKGATLDKDGKPVELRGLDALLKSDNLIKTLESAGYNGVYTKYFAMDAAKASAAITQANAGGLVNADQAMSNGVLLSCGEVYALLTKDITEHANALLTASSDAWTKTGTMVQLDATMNAMLGAVGSVGGANKFSAMGSPQSFISQQAVINQMSGSFRQAAIQTGNSEFLTAANLAQAEQNQKSAWVAGAAVFNNMMGYVYSVLQAFIFAIMPIVVIALFVPGLGKGIFTNYAQILVWLALWSPMLAIINYLVYLFGTEQVGTVYTLNGGPNYMNTAIISEKTNDMVIAAQFLGISTPLITWGLVKGALAFTEFINHGIGSSFAQQAGASAASGNMSMGNISMDNTSMNKFNTAFSSTVGFQQTQAYNGAGAQLQTAQGGGNTHEQNGDKTQNTMSLTKEQSQAISASKDISATFSAASSQNWSKQQTFDYAAQSMSGEQFKTFMDVSNKAGINWSAEQRVAQARSHDETAQVNRQLQEAQAASAKAGASLSLNPMKLGAGLDANLSTNLQAANAYNKAHGLSEKEDTAKSAANAHTKGKDFSHGTGTGTSKDYSETARTGNGETTTFGKSLSKAVSESEKFTETLQASYRKANNQSLGQGVDHRTQQEIQGSIDAPVPGIEKLNEAKTRLQGQIDTVAAQRDKVPEATDFKEADGFNANYDAAKAKQAGTRALVKQGAAAVAADKPPVDAEDEAKRRIARVEAGVAVANDSVKQRGEVIASVADKPSVVMATGSLMSLSIDQFTK